MLRAMAVIMATALLMMKCLLRTVMRTMLCLDDDEVVACAEVSEYDGDDVDGDDDLVDDDVEHDVCVIVDGGTMQMMLLLILMRWMPVAIMMRVV